MMWHSYNYSVWLGFTAQFITFGWMYQFYTRTVSKLR